MAKSVNKKRKGVDSLMQYQMRDQIWSLNVIGKPDLIDFEIGDNGKGNDVYITMHSDYRKENVINTSVTGSTLVGLSITHGANGTEERSVLTLDLTNLDAKIKEISDQIADLQARVTALESA